MKKIKVLFLCIAMTLISCERDDICAESTSTSPRLLIEFYDATSTDDLKNVPRLTLYGEGLIIDPTVSTDTTIVYNANANSAELPLKIEPEEGELRTVTRYIIEKDTNLRLDDDQTTQSNIDILEISYVSELQYVSRACGYKSIFKALSVSFDNDGDVWLSSIEVIDTEIKNENTVHVKIYH